MCFEDRRESPHGHSYCESCRRSCGPRWTKTHNYSHASYRETKQNILPGDTFSSVWFRLTARTEGRRCREISRNKSNFERNSEGSIPSKELSLSLTSEGRKNKLRVCRFCCRQEIRQTCTSHRFPSVYLTVFLLYGDVVIPSISCAFTLISFQCFRCLYDIGSNGVFAVVFWF